MPTSFTYDFEATSTNPHEAQPIQLAFIVYDSVTKKSINKDLYIKFPKKFDDCSSNELSALEFNGISRNVVNPDMSISERRKKFAFYRNHKDSSHHILAKNYYISIDEHNSLAKEPQKVIFTILDSLKEFDRIDILQGFNIIAYDNIILDSFFQKYHNMTFSSMFKYKVNDVFVNLTNLASRFGLDFPDNSKIEGRFFGNNYFNAFIYDSDYPHGRSARKGEGLFKLENLHRRVFGENSLTFHNAIADVIATIDLNNHYLEYWKPKYIPSQESVEELIKVCATCGKSIDLDFCVTSNSGAYYHRDFHCLKQGLNLEYEKKQEKNGIQN